MIRSLQHESPQPGSRADVCIVGAGAAGIVLAVELAAYGKRVLLLEGGAREVEEFAQEPYRSDVVGHNHRGVHVGRFRAHGGTTRRWGGQILELDAIDFETRDWVAGSGWPIAKESLKPYYARALQLEGVGATIADDAQVWRSLGEATPALRGLEPYFSRWCPEPDFTKVHRAALDGPAIEVWLHANVVALQMNGDVVCGVQARTYTGKEHTFVADEYVFALGAIESSRFFLQPREEGLPWNESGLVGRYFQDHIDANAARVEVKDARRFHNLFDNVFLSGLKYHPKLRLAPSLQQQWKTLNVAATMNFVSDSDELLAQNKATAKRLMRGRLKEVRPRDVAQLAGNVPLLAKQGWRYLVQHRMWNAASSQVYLRVHCEQEPLGESRITLADERDSLGLYRTRLDWRIADSELRTIRYYVEQAKQSLAGLADVVADARLIAKDVSEFSSVCDDSNHHMGGMRMAADGEPGVVSPDLLLRGTKNCYVLSSATFPTSGFSNPTHTLLALACRLAERLRR